MALSDRSFHSQSIYLIDADGIFKFLGHQSWGTCSDGTFAMGCGAEEFQQEIRNCADVTIESPVTKGFLFDPPSRSAIDANADDEEGTATAHIDLLGDDVMLLDCGGQEVESRFIHCFDFRNKNIVTSHYRRSTMK